eukprot:TRINITY_DN270_c0_g1_i1.p2 TRINITY_DN270_c0_g1~~TRINITY_DN270_c0_g1_i1.p2  ORF type:complete len:119 (-),score=3.76 TRINITY_DN270_c0_g1_i1:790-1146(-)
MKVARTFKNNFLLRISPESPRREEPETDNLPAKEVILLNDHPESWTVQEACGWMRMKGFQQHSILFHKHEVCGQDLLELTDEDLLDAGVENRFHRQAILRETANLRRKRRYKQTLYYS